MLILVGFQNNVLNCTQMLDNTQFLNYRVISIFYSPLSYARGWDPLEIPGFTFIHN